MKKILFTTIVAVGLVLMACPYEGKVELNSAEESLKIDKKLIDDWVCFNEEGAREELMIEKGEKSVLNIAYRRFDKKSSLKESNKFRAYATEIGGYDIFNIKSTDDEEGYIYAKYGWTGKNEFYIQYINSTYVDANFEVDSVTTENLRAFFTEHVNNEKMYDEKLEFYRKGSPEYLKVKIYMKKSGF